jgi:predicted DNA-binding antitoxin AbrB/MazE fold protein
MSQVLTAVFKGGVFRPLEPVELEEPIMVEIQVRPVEYDLSTPYHPSKLKEWTEKYNLSPDITEILAEDWTAGLTLNEILALNGFVGTGGVLGPGTDIEELCAREDIWDAE